MTDMAYSRNERSISTLISIGSIPGGRLRRHPPLSCPGDHPRKVAYRHLDVQEPYFAGVVEMNCLRCSTSSPIRMLHASSAIAACSISTRRRVRAAGSIVVRRARASPSRQAPSAG